jgi:hypothetical protein
MQTENEAYSQFVSSINGMTGSILNYFPLCVDYDVRALFPYQHVAHVFHHVQFLKFLCQTLQSKMSPLQEQAQGFSASGFSILCKPFLFL